MKRQDLKVLIVDDDPTLGKAIFEALKRQGYSPKLFPNGAQALAFAKVSEIHAAVIDCLIPRQNGVDFAVDLKRKCGSHIKIILMSGIYKDRGFIRDAEEKAGSSFFLLKPFDIPMLVGILDSEFGDLIEDNFSQPKDFILAKSDVQKLTEDLLSEPKVYSGLNLPFVFAALSQGKKSGTLHLESETKNGSSKGWVSFHRGLIQGVNWPDAQSYFGILLVEKGVISEEELESALQSKGDKKIGERLVDVNSISPHFIQMVNREQSKIRLAKMISDVEVKMHWETEEVPENLAGLSSRDFIESLNDWAFSKMPIHFLEGIFTSFADMTVGNAAQELEETKRFSILQYAPGILDSLGEGHTIAEVINANPKKVEEAYRALYFLFVSGGLKLSSRKQTDYKLKTDRLEHILKSQAAQTHYEVLGLPVSARPTEIQASYIELAKAFHPDKLQKDCPEDLKKLTTEIFARISLAHEVLKDDSRRHQYRTELESGKANDILAIEGILEEARTKLESGQFRKVIEILAPGYESTNSKKAVLLHYYWARMKLGISNKDLESFGEKFNYDIQSIPPEDRHNYLFFFIKGLYYKTLGNYKKAYTYFKHSLTSNREFKPAQTEYMILKRQLKKPEADTLMTAVTSLFKKAK